MYKIRIIQVGKTKDSYIESGIAEFEKRLSRFCSVDTVTIKEGVFSKNTDIQREVTKETESIIQHIDQGSFVVYLDIFSKEKSSEEFASFISEKIDVGMPLTFIIGGAYGCDLQTLNPHVHLKLSLSKMTFTHQLIRLVILEQLYRAFTIINDIPYHH